MPSIAAWDSANRAARAVSATSAGVGVCAVRTTYQSTAFVGTELFYVGNSSLLEATTTVDVDVHDAGVLFAVPANNGAVPHTHRRSYTCGSRRTSDATFARASCGAWTAAAGGPGRIRVRCGPSRRVRRPPRTWSARTGRPRGLGHRRCAPPRRAAGILRVRR